MRTTSPPSTVPCSLELSFAPALEQKPGLQYPGSVPPVTAELLCDPRQVPLFLPLENGDTLPYMTRSDSDETRGVYLETQNHIAEASM